jgi:hypothetical protein
MYFGFEFDFRAAMVWIEVFKTGWLGAGLSSEY